MATVLIVDTNEFDMIEKCPKCGAPMGNVEVLKVTATKKAFFRQRCSLGDYAIRTPKSDEEQPQTTVEESIP